MEEMLDPAYPSSTVLRTDINERRAFHIGLQPLRSNIPSVLRGIYSDTVRWLA